MNGNIRLGIYEQNYTGENILTGIHGREYGNGNTRMGIYGQDHTDGNIRTEIYSQNYTERNIRTGIIRTGIYGQEYRNLSIPAEIPVISRSGLCFLFPYQGKEESGIIRELTIKTWLFVYVPIDFSLTNSWKGSVFFVPVYSVMRKQRSSFSLRV